jgi:hypothetical protein
VEVGSYLLRIELSVIVDMKARTLSIIFNIGIFVLLVVLVLQVAACRVVSADGEGPWVMAPIAPCSNCNNQGPFGHHYPTKDDCEKAYTEWVRSMGAVPPGQVSTATGVGVPAKCVMSNSHPETP